MERKAHSLVYIVVDALRFDFALYDLPRSLGKRFTQHKGQLFQFVADPPTVTMQRLKALTTGGLPTFAEFTTNMGGAHVADDSWVRLLQSTPWQDRGLSGPSQTAFVGDDTWADLYPTEFTTALPYPSFNTRDLDTVDNGCLHHVPELMDHLRGLSSPGSSKNSTSRSLNYEVVVVHFLGVDHVGHTYGPHNKHMDAKLRQMDDAMAEILDRIDASTECHVTLIMGDHGMTPDGNHGGGTEEETHAALFVHASTGCGPEQNRPDWHLEDVRRSELVQQEFGQIHQIDLVPTISILLGLPVPYANLGSLVPSFLPATSTAEAATGLALNAAQVWRYFTIYSQTANRLPQLEILQENLNMAMKAYRRALKDDENEDLFLQAATLFKDFLHKALALGQRVWTRFDTVGMVFGIIILAVGLFTQIMLLILPFDAVPVLCHLRIEDVVAGSFSVFIWGVLTFSNSYILEEEHIVLYALSIISTVVALRIRAEPVQATIWRGVLLVPVASRISGLLVNGHGSDPALRVHPVHNSLVFLPALAILGAWRWWLYQNAFTIKQFNALLDCGVLTCLAVSWWEKRQPDSDRNGYMACRAALILLCTGAIVQIGEMVKRLSGTKDQRSISSSTVIEWIIKVLLAIAVVTGPSTASTLILVSFQMVVVFLLSRWESPLRVSSMTLASFWRLLVRHAFFSTNHACTLNRLQLSAAFVATHEFDFTIGGISLFLNTFGWEIVGILFVYLCSCHKGREATWRSYGSLQILEALTSCISVSLLRRHLMVWDIYAPHFLFVSIFTLLCGFANIVVAVSEVFR